MLGGPKDFKLIVTKSPELVEVGFVILLLASSICVLRRKNSKIIWYKQTEIIKTICFWQTKITKIVCYKQR
jgi:hypothetical protein